METKKHYKLYKSGKLWMTAMISVGVLAVANVAYADTAEQASTPTSTDTSIVTSDASNSGNLAVEVPVTHSSAAQTTAPPANAQVEKITSGLGNIDDGQSSANQPVASAANNAVSSDPARQPSQAVATPVTRTEAEQEVATFTQPQVNSTITVNNPSNYPTDAAKLVGKNQFSESYYIYQIVNLDGAKINGLQARLILSVDPRNPQGANYAYVTDEKYKKAYQTITINSGEYKDISVSSTGGAIKNPTRNQIYRVSNTGPFTLDFNGKKITVPASLSIKSVGSGNGRGVSPVYGLGNQNNISYSDKVDISPENKAPAIEYIYLDKDGNYTSSNKLPANVPVNGITGQQFTITNVDEYKQVLNGLYLTNQQGSLANSADGSYKGTISQFQIGQYYEKTLYNWDRTVSQTLIYKLIDPQGTMEISLLRPNKKTETVTVPVGEHKVFSNGTLVRNPFVPGANSVQLVYADLGKIIPVDENGNVISDLQPVYNNDPSNPHKAGATAAPDLTAQGWVLQTPSDATIIPSNPGEDTKVVYVRVVTNTVEKTVTQTVKYQYADGITAGRPALPGDKVQKATFIHTVITNPVTGQVISDTWTPAQQFTAETSPTIAGFWADQKEVGGNAEVTQDTPSLTFVVKYSGPNEEISETKVTQTVNYVYSDGITAGRPPLPSSNVQTLTFTATTHRNPETDEVISTTWSGPQNFTIVLTPEVDGYYYNKAQEGSTDKVTHESADTEYTVYYAPPTVTSQDKTITQTIHYQYADGETQGRPPLPKDDVQTITFTETLHTNPFTGHVVSFGWTPDYNKFSIVQTPTINGFYADLAHAGSDKIMVHEDLDTYYVVNYAAPVSTVTESKRVNQTIRYEYADGVTTDRPALPQTDTQSLVFDRTVVTNPWTNEVISDTWSPAQNFTVLATPTIDGYYYNLAQAGSNAAVTYQSADSEYIVKYAPANVQTSDKTVTQTIKYHYAEGVNGDPALLPTDNVQSLTFTNTVLTNPWTGEVITNTWSPAQNFAVIDTPRIDGYFFDQSQAGSAASVTHESADSVYDVYYLAPETTETKKEITQTIRYEYADGITTGRPALPQTNVQTLTFFQTIKRDPITGAIIADEWTEPQKFGIVSSQQLAGFYYDQAQAGSDKMVTHDDASTEYVVKYAPASIMSEEKNVSQTIRYEYADGVTAERPSLPATNVQNLSFIHTVTTNPWTKEVISDTWSPAQSFTVVNTPVVEGFYYDQAQAGSNAAVTYESGNTEYLVKYAPVNVTTENKTVTQTIYYHYASGVNGNPALLPATNVQSVDFTRTTLTNPWTGEVISDTWSPGQNFTVVVTPQIDGYYYDQAQAGSTVTVNHNSPDTVYNIYYLAPTTTSEEKTITQTIRYEYADGITADRPALPQTNLQTLSFTQTIVRNPITGEIESITWTDPQSFNVIKTPRIDGYYYDLATAGSNQLVTHDSANTEYVVKYAPAKIITEDKQVTQTVRYEYADGQVNDRPALPQSDVQTVNFTHTTTLNPFTDEVISSTWSPAQQFSIVNTATIDGYYYNHAQAGSTAQVTHDSADTEYVVKYSPADIQTTDKTVTQTVKYQYADGITNGRPALPANEVQALTFTQTVARNPFTGEVISATWSPAQNFTLVNTPPVTGFYFDLAQAGSTTNVTHESSNTEYVVNYAPANVTTTDKVVNQTIRYEYADGVTTGRPMLPQNVVQTLTFTQTTATNPFTGEVVSTTWSPAQSFTLVDTPTIDGYYYDQAQAGSTAQVTHESSDTEYVVKYAAPTVTTETKEVTQTIKYEYNDGVTAGRPTLPSDNVTSVDFVHTVITNPWTGEVIQDTWSPDQIIPSIASPTIDGFYADRELIPEVTVSNTSQDLHYVVKYAAPTVTTETEKVTQNIKYEYSDGVTVDRPSLPENNTITVDFTHTVVTNPWTGEIIEDKWSPDKVIPAVPSPEIDGFHPDHETIPEMTISHTSKDLNYVVKYDKNVETPAPETPAPEKPVVPSKPTPTEPVAPAPEEPVVPSAPVVAPKPTEVTPVETANQPAASVVADKKVENTVLPQTGSQDTVAIAGLGLVTAFAALFGLSKRKRKS